MADGGYKPLPEEDPDEENPTELDPRRTDDGDWTPGRRRGEHRSSSRHQYETKKGSSTGFVNPSYEDEDRPPPPPKGWEGLKIFEEEGGGQIAIKSSKMDRAWDAIREKYDCDPKKAPFVARMVDGKVEVALIKGKKILPKSYRLFKEDGELRKGLPSKITIFLGNSREEIVMENLGVSRGKEEEASALRRRAETTSDPSERDRLVEQAEQREEEAENIREENERVREGMSLRDRVKSIFKERGFTVFAVLTAIGAVIGSILSNLKSGLANVAKGVGKGLKDLGAKLAGILPGMVGAIAKFLFDTAGEVVGFLAEHAWVIVVGLVVLVVESLKKKVGRKK